MNATRKFELCFYSGEIIRAKPNELERWNLTILPYEVWDQSGATFASTGVRAFDTQSYFLARVLVRERSFGFINQRKFFWLDLTNGERHEFLSKEVAKALQADKASVGSVFRMRYTTKAV